MGIGFVEELQDITPHVEIVSEKPLENKPRNMDEFIAKVATPAPESLARKEEPIVKEEPVIVKPEQKSNPTIKSWMKLVNDIKA